jgi:hypothetical protein
MSKEKIQFYDRENNDMFVSLHMILQGPAFLVSKHTLLMQTFQLSLNYRSVELSLNYRSVELSLNYRSVELSLNYRSIELSLTVNYRTIHC